jgi:hypothetical protein
MDVLDLLQKIENHLLSKVYNNKHRHSLEKIYHILEIIDKSISGLADDDKTVTETLSFDELMQSFDDQAKQNNKDAKKERIRIPTCVPHDIAKDGNHPLLGELYSTLKQIRQEQRSNQEINGDDYNNNSTEATIDRMVDDVPTAIDDYDDNKISFEIGGRHYDDLMKWEKSNDDRLFRYQLETGKMWPDSDYDMCESTLERFKIIAKEGATARPYYGSNGAGYLYKFCPTSIGLTTTLENLVTKEEIDLIDYEG